MTFVDRMMLNHWSGAAMSAAFVGGVIWWAVICLPLGVASYVGTFVAQYHGSKQSLRIGPAVWQGVWVSAAVSPLLLALTPFAEDVFRLAGHSGKTAELEGSYFAILCLSSPAMLFSAALSCFWSGRGKTVLVMIVDALFAGVNLLLDWCWIFGLTLPMNGTEIEIFPAAGIEGAAWATTVAMWLKAGVYLALMLAKVNRETYAANLWRPERELLRRVLWFGTPSGVQMLLDVAGFTAFVLIVAKLGATAGEATSMTFSIGHLAFMPIVGFGMAASILVGQHLGENRDSEAARATWTSLQVSWVYMAAISAAFVFTPQLFLAGFYAGEPIDGDAERRVEVAATAATLLYFVAGYNLLDAMAIVFASALKGAGDTRFILFISLIMAPILGVSTWVAVEVFALGVYGCWAVVAVWIGVLAMIYLARFLHGAWRSMRVIEPTPIESA
ncbi:MAG: MATE family efflux transporter [Planctomycetota bacterium]